MSTLCDSVYLFAQYQCVWHTDALGVNVCCVDSDVSGVVLLLLCCHNGIFCSFHHHSFQTLICVVSHFSPSYAYHRCCLTLSLLT